MKYLFNKFIVLVICGIFTLSATHANEFNNIDNEQIISFKISFENGALKLIIFNKSFSIGQQDLVQKSPLGSSTNVPENCPDGDFFCEIPKLNLRH